MADMKSSWVARWQRLDGYIPGVYAVKVVGTVSDSSFLSIDKRNARWGYRSCIANTHSSILLEMKKKDLEPKDYTDRLWL